MKKRSVLWVVGLVWVMLMLFTTAATAANTVYFDPDPSSAAPGTTTTVTLWLDASDGVASFNTWVHFNLSVVNITNGAAGDFPGDFWFDYFGDYVKIGGHSSNGLDQTGHLKLADLTVKAISPGTSVLSYTNNRLYNVTPVLVSATWINGTFTCGECLGTCCNDSSCSDAYRFNVTCHYCIGLEEEKYWKPNRDSACFDEYPTADLCLSYCPECCNGIDDADEDTDIDFPSDLECTCGLDPSEASPAAPIPELPPIVLFCMGLLTLTGYVLWKKRS
jgi:hypothetical protein